MEVLTEPPQSTSFIPLAEHQSTTPESFYNGPPVLHYYSDRCKVVVLEDELSVSPAIASLVNKSRATSSNGAGQQQSNGNEGGAQHTVEHVDIWVTSEKVFLFSTGLETGLSIPYPSISLHAIQSLPEPSAVDTLSRGLYMQLIVSPLSPSSDEEPESISVTIIPTASGVPTSASTANPAGSATAQQVTDEISTESLSEITPVEALFAALSNCSNLHPDPIDPDDQEALMQFEGAGDEAAGGLAGSRLFQAGLLQPGSSGDGLPPPMPGSGGWITAENMHEYFDEHGNWIGGDEEDGDAEMGDDDDDGDGVDNEEQAHADRRGVAENSAPLGPGAGTVRPRDESDGTANGGNGSDHHDQSEEAKWRRTG